MSKLCWPYDGHDPKVECSHYGKNNDCCEFDEQPCDNKMGHPETGGRYLDDGAQYVVLHHGADSGYPYQWINQTTVIAVLNSMREVVEYRKSLSTKAGISITKVGCVV